MYVFDGEKQRNRSVQLSIVWLRQKNYLVQDVTLLNLKKRVTTKVNTSPWFCISTLHLCVRALYHSWKQEHATISSSIFPTRSAFLVSGLKRNVKMGTHLFKHFHDETPYLILAVMLAKIIWAIYNGEFDREFLDDALYNFLSEFHLFKGRSIFAVAFLYFFITDVLGTSLSLSTSSCKSREKNRNLGFIQPFLSVEYPHATLSSSYLQVLAEDLLYGPFSPQSQSRTRVIDLPVLNTELVQVEACVMPSP